MLLLQRNVRNVGTLGLSEKSNERLFYKRRVIIGREAFNKIRQSVVFADNKYETGGVLIGYALWKWYFVVEVTTSDVHIKSKVSFFLDGNEHTQKVNEIISTSKYQPSVLGIWHSHICDGHSFSKQDMISNKVFAKSFGGMLSMLVTKPEKDIVFSTKYISSIGIAERCITKIRLKSERR